MKVPFPHKERRKNNEKRWTSYNPGRSKKRHMDYEPHHYTPNLFVIGMHQTLPKQKHAALYMKAVTTKLLKALTKLDDGKVAMRTIMYRPELQMQLIIRLVCCTKQI